MPSDCACCSKSGVASTSHTKALEVKECFDYLFSFVIVLSKHGYVQISTTTYIDLIWVQILVHP